MPIARLILLASFVLLLGCPGTLVLGVDGDDDDAAGDDDDAAGDDDAVGDDDDDDDDPVVPSSCAPGVQPNTSDQVYAYGGSATLTPTTPTGVCNFSWSGCEALKLFDDSDLVCEVVWDVAGPCIDFGVAWNGANEVVYDLVFTLNTTETTCTGDEAGWVDDRIEDQEWDYQLTWFTGTQDLEVLWSSPDEDDYEEWADTTFAVDSSGTITFDFDSSWRSW